MLQRSASLTNPPATDDPSDYFLEIESHFARVRGTTFLFSSKDWALMKQWQEDGVPLAIVLEAIESCFTKKREGGRRKTISSLSYCRHAVDELWSERKDLYVGKSDRVPESDPASGLAQLTEELRSIAQSVAEQTRASLEEAAARVTAIRSKSVPDIEQELLAIEEELLIAVEKGLSADERQSIEAAIAKQAAYAGDAAAAERMRSANIKRLLRKQLSLPRLSLFR